MVVSKSCIVHGDEDRTRAVSLGSRHVRIGKASDANADEDEQLLYWNTWVRIEHVWTLRMTRIAQGSRQTPTRCNPDTRCPPTKKEARCTRDGDKRFGSGRSHVSPSLGEEDAPSRTLEYAPLGASPLGNALGSAHRRATKAQRSFARLESIVPRIFLDDLDR